MCYLHLAEEIPFMAQKLEIVEDASLALQLET